jgi:hypothetical protein
MTTDPDKHPETPENGSERPEKGRFNPFLNEDDMFKVVLWVAGGVLVVAALAVLAQAVL